MTPNILSHTHTHTHHHATQRAGSRKLTSTYTGIPQWEPGNVPCKICLLGRAHIHNTRTDTPSPIHCFGLWHVLAVTLTSSISQLDSRRDARACSTLNTRGQGKRRWRERERERERGGIREKTLTLISSLRSGCQFSSSFPYASVQYQISSCSAFT